MMKRLIAYATVAVLCFAGAAQAQKYSEFVNALTSSTPLTSDRIALVRPTTSVATTVDGLRRLGTPTAIGLMSLVNPSTSLTDLTDFYLFRDANYTGGSWANVNTVISASTTNRAGNLGLEWNAWFQLDNYGTLADASENTSTYMNSVKRTTGSTWAAIAQVTDYSTGVASGQTIGLEIDMQVNNADTSSNRTMLEMYVNKTVGSADPPTVTYGMRFDGAGALYYYGIAFDGVGSNYWNSLLGVVNAPRYLHGIDLTTGLCDSDNFKSLGFLVDCSGNVAGNALAIGTPTGGLKGVGTINAQNAYYANGTIGVSCAVGTLNPVTAVVINGIITTC